MAEVVANADHQQLHHFATNADWDERAVYDQVAREADAVLGDAADSCLLIDESSFVKKGGHSVGVARQWCGRLGKLENCQVASLCLGTRHTLIDTRLYLPKEWIENRKRCLNIGVPEEQIIARSKTQHALAMVEHGARDERVESAEPSSLGSSTPRTAAKPHSDTRGHGPSPNPTRAGHRGDLR